MFFNLINPRFSFQIGQCQHLANIHRDRRQYWLLLYEATGRIQ